MPESERPADVITASIAEADARLREIDAWCARRTESDTHAHLSSKGNVPHPATEPEILAQRTDDVHEELITIITGPRDARPTCRAHQRTWDTCTSARCPLFPLTKRKPEMFPSLRPGITVIADVTYAWDFLDFGHEVTASINTERNRAGIFRFKLLELAYLLHKCLGQKADGIVCALWERSLREWGDGKDEHKRRKFDAVPADDASTICDMIAEALNLEARSDPLEYELLEEAFGEDVCGQALGRQLRSDEYKQSVVPFSDLLQTVVPDLFSVAATSDALRWKMLQTFRRWMRTPDRTLASAIIRRGWKELTNVREVTEREWLKHLREKGKTDVEKLPASRPARLLRNVIDVPRIRRELEHVRGLGLDALAAKETAIAYEVFAAVARMPYGAHTGHWPRSYRTATPRHVAEKRVVNCASGPWLIAALLRECGIPEEQLFHCTVFEQPDINYFGAHGALLMATSKRDLFFIDRGALHCGHPMQASFCERRDEEESLKSFLEGKHDGPVTATVKQDLATTLTIPRRLQIMPLAEGFSAMHMLHVGLTFFHQKHYDEAREAFEIGLSFNPEHPDLLYFLGLIAFKENRCHEAWRYLSGAVQIYEGHLLAHMALGELCLHLRQPRIAREHFGHLCMDLRPIWRDGSGSIKKKALDYFNLSDADMVRAWQQQQEENACSRNRGRKRRG